MTEERVDRPRLFVFGVEVLVFWRELTEERVDRRRLFEFWVAGLVL